MKKKTDHVTNSSSVSFCAFGLNESDKTRSKRIVDILEGVDEGTSLVWDDQFGDASLMYGLSVSQMKDNETLLQFKQRCVDEINRILASNYAVKDIKLLQRGYYNG